jgi:hypothetical protein
MEYFFLQILHFSAAETRFSYQKSNNFRYLLENVNFLLKSPNFSQKKNFIWTVQLEFANMGGHLFGPKGGKGGK